MALPFLAANLGYKAVRDYVVPLFSKKPKPIPHVPPKLLGKRDRSGNTKPTASQNKSAVSSMPKRSRGVSRGRAKTTRVKKRKIVRRRKLKKGRRGKKSMTGGSDGSNPAVGTLYKRPSASRGLVRWVNLETGTAFSNVGRWSPWSVLELNTLPELASIFQNCFLTQPSSVNPNPAGPTNPNPQIVTSAGLAPTNFTQTAPYMKLKMKWIGVTLEFGNVCNSNIVVEMMILKVKENSSEGSFLDILNNLGVSGNPQLGFLGGPIAQGAPTISNSLSETFDCQSDNNFKKLFRVHGRHQFFLGSGDTRRLQIQMPRGVIDGGKMLAQQSQTEAGVGPIYWIKGQSYGFCFRTRGKISLSNVENEATFVPAALVVSMKTEIYTSLSKPRMPIVLQQIYGSDVGIQLAGGSTAPLGNFINSEADAPNGFIRVT